MKLKLFLTTALCALSTLTVAQSIKMEMMQMNMQANKLVRAKTAEEFQLASQDFITITEKTKAILPNGVEGNQKATEDYQVGMQKLIDIVKQANEQAQAGNLQDAKIAISELEILKREYHKKYK
ncbi:cytochrome b562 [Mannheimia sp. AT1]|uniref:Cytochrome b562 n=1 Tax=Mannheimia cairinae TaxID=3025936 RepID=A0ABT5MNU8_9PAST|nr:cytochrome b562 [Mannheimia cairinae]MDD0823663.1 cytochrome b562 [Mannheimia cairinae]MDD0825405.1 cytochrome b562 [Mannheimia cairinae]